MACDFECGFDRAISEVVNHAKKVDVWMKAGGRGIVARRIGVREAG